MTVCAETSAQERARASVAPTADGRGIVRIIRRGLCKIETSRFVDSIMAEARTAGVIFASDPEGWDNERGTGDGSTCIGAGNQAGLDRSPERGSGARVPG